MPRFPVILWAYLLTELWRLILLTACVLVTVLAFAAAVRFLADGKLGPVDTIRLMFLAMPPMLQYALPFAAGFGATLAYHRVCADNEATAAHGAGVSHRALLAPALISGVVLGLAVLALANMVIPRFLRSMEELVTRDAARIIVGSIERKEAVRMDRTLLYADLVRQSPDTGDGGYQRLYLQHLLAVELDENGEVRAQVTAKEADVWLVRAAADPGAGEGGAGMGETVTHVIVESRGMVGEEAGGRRVQDETNVLARTIPNAFTDDPKFKSWDELGRLRREPERLNSIDSRRRVLAAHLAERATTDRIDAALRGTGEVELQMLDGSKFVLYGTGIRWVGSPEEYWEVAPPVLPDGKPGKVIVQRRTETGRIVRQAADVATFRTHVDPNAPEREVTIEISLRGVALTMKEQSIGGLSVAGAPAAPLMRAGSSELLTAADARVAGHPEDDYVKGPRDDLRRRIADLMREITSKQHERFASAAACLVMVMTGAVMAIRLRAKLPLEVYLWAFFPALATVITISAGQQMIHAKGMVGIPIMWGGVAGLALYTFVQFRRVARH